MVYHFCDEMRKEQNRIYLQNKTLFKGLEEINFDHYYYDKVKHEWKHNGNKVKYCQWCGQQFDHWLVVVGGVD